MLIRVVIVVGLAKAIRERPDVYIMRLEFAPQPRSLAHDETNMGARIGVHHPAPLVRCSTVVVAFDHLVAVHEVVVGAGGEATSSGPPGLFVGTRRVAREKLRKRHRISRLKHFAGVANLYVDIGQVRGQRHNAGDRRGAVGKEGEEFHGCNVMLFGERNHSAWIYTLMVGKASKFYNSIMRALFFLLA